MYEVLEVGGVFGVLNQGVPTAVIGAYHRVKKVQTGVLSMNLIYMFIMLVILLVALLIKGG